MADEEDLEEETTRIAMRKATVENLCTPNIEALLKDLKEDLKVVHTVDPAEALDNLPLWIPAIQAELGSLDGFNAIERLKGKEARDFASSPTTKMVPGKLVFTVMPPSKEGEGYKRKVRVVSCGNHVEKDSSALYSAGVQAEIVRLMVAIAAQKGYSLSVTDVKNAFLRAPLTEPKAMAYDHPALRRGGFVEDGEVWKACIAGLRPLASLDLDLPLLGGGNEDDELEDVEGGFSEVFAGQSGRSRKLAPASPASHP